MIGGAVADDLPIAARPGPTSTARAPLAGLRRGAFLASLLQGSGVACRYATQLALARWAGPTAFGQWAYATNLSQFASTPADGGYATSVTRFIPEALAAGDRRTQAALIRTSRMFTLVTGAFITAIAVVAVTALGGGVAPLSVLLVALAVTPLYALIEVQTGLCRSFEHVVAAYLPPLVVQPVLVAAGVGVYVMWGHPTAWVLVAVTSVAVAAVCVQQALSLRRLRPAVESARPTHAQVRRWRKVSLPLLLLSLSNLVFSRLDLLLVGVFLGAASAGVYSVAFRTAAVATLVQTGISAVVTPRMARLHWAGDRESLQATILSGTRWIVAGSALVSIPLVVFAHPILGMFGPAFQPGATALIVYLVGQLIGVCAGPVGWLLAISGEHRRAAGIGVVAAATTAVAYLLMIPAFGLIGAAAANSAGMVIRNLWSNVEVRRRLGYRVDPISAFLSRHPRETI